MLKLVSSLLGSKKAVVTLVGLVLEIVIASGVIALDAESKMKVMEAILVIVGGYNVGQGIADHGKEKAKAEKGVQ